MTCTVYTNLRSTGLRHKYTVSHRHCRLTTTPTERHPARLLHHNPAQQCCSWAMSLTKHLSAELHVWQLACMLPRLHTVLPDIGP